MYNNETGSDVIFIVGPEKWRFPGHKNVLAAASPVFEAMFDGFWDTKDAAIHIVDVEGKGFDNLLR